MSLFKKKIRTKVQKSVFLKKSVQKSVQVGTLLLTANALDIVAWSVLSAYSSKRTIPLSFR